MSSWSLQEKLGLDPKKVWSRPACLEKASAVAATAETFQIAIPRDHFIHAVTISIGEGTTSAGATLADDLTVINFIGNGNKYMKKLTADMVKELQVLRGENPATGLYKLFFTDPKIPEAKPLPAWIFTSLTLELTDNAPAASNFHYINVTLLESAYQDEDLSAWKLLIEKYLTDARYGANTGWQKYELERAYKIYGYLFVMDDDGSLSDTIFTKLLLHGRQKNVGDRRLVDEVLVTHIKEQNKTENNNIAHATGYMSVGYPQGLPSYDFTSLNAYLYIASAGTDAGLKVVERYCL